MCVDLYKNKTQIKISWVMMMVITCMKCSGIGLAATWPVSVSFHQFHHDSRNDEDDGYNDDDDDNDDNYGDDDDDD